MVDTNESSALRRRSRELIESFLQTAVILDDLAEMPKPGGEQPVEIEPRSIDAPSYRILPAENPVEGHGDPRDFPLNAEAVINGFAEIGSLCAVLRPAPDEEYHERTMKVASRADIVILDWKLHDSTGDEALDLLKEILNSDTINYRLRLLAIYTGEPNLEGVSERVKDAISEFYGDKAMDARDPYRITKGPLRIVILAKEGMPDSSGSAAGAQQTSELDLASRLVDEFARMTEGLLRNVALAGISAIRKQSHRILTKFDSQLDAAYLGDRQLLPNPADAEDQLTDALAAEILAVLNDDRPGVHADARAIKDWLVSKEAAGLDLSSPFSFAEAASTIDRWHALLSCGINGPNVITPHGAKANTLAKRGTEAFTDTPDSAMDSNHNFAALLSLRTQYVSRTRRLTLGSIIHNDHDDKYPYLLCLQPQCDSIRLDAATGFPMIRLKENESSFRLVVEVELGIWKHFDVVLKPSELVVRSFEPAGDSSGEVLAFSENGRWFFRDTKDRTYRWIAEMKSEYALTLAGEIASSLSRPGPDNSEWLRRASR